MYNFYKKSSDIDSLFKDTLNKNEIYSKLILEVGSF